MSRLSRILGALPLVAATIYVTPAHAQATRTWVSGVGDDANPCSRTAPCKTFAGAISKTAANGEIDCLDPGGFGTVTITKSITIDCDGTFGSVLAAGTNGININDSASGSPNTISVVLRGLSINGAVTGLVGINFTSGRSLVLDEVIIQNFQTSSATGISMRPGGAGQLTTGNVILTGNVTGILIQPTGTGTARVTLGTTRIERNTGAGVSINTTGNTGNAGIGITLDGSTVSNNGGAGVSVLQPASTQNVGMMITNSLISNNLGTGISAAGGGTILRVGSSTITANAAGVVASSGAQVLSYADNRLDGNPTAGAANDGAFTGTIIHH